MKTERVTTRHCVSMTIEAYYMGKHMDAHVAEYYDYLDALDWHEAMQQMKRDEGIWEDNGCSWPGN